LIAILDYGSGNLRSAERAFATAGKEVVVTSDRAIALEAEGLVVPGVGAFAACMNGLNAVDGAAIVRERLAKERPTLGICIGMQIMFSEGTEHSEDGTHAGIGIWQGTVSKLNAPILPHMGWNTVRFTQPASPLRDGLDIEGESFYFVHSFHCVPADPALVLGECDYGGVFAAAIGRGRCFATQFHPEKSQAKGLQIYRNFAAVAAAVGRD
jgi:glutamine amidotransferase